MLLPDKRVMVPGATGLIGSNLLEHLLKEGVTPKIPRQKHAGRI